MDDYKFVPITLNQHHTGQATPEEIADLYSHPRLRHIAPGSLPQEIENQLALELRDNNHLKIFLPKNNSVFHMT